MPRYIDADELYKKLYPLDLADKSKYTINAKAVADAITNIPTADVVPKSEVARLEQENETIKDNLDVMLEEAKAEVAREIFEEIENAIDLKFLIIKKMLDSKGGRANGKTILVAECGVLTATKRLLAELKKKYTEGS
jgi:hypothetical protein